MDGATETKPEAKEVSAEANERSTVDFPYTDLDAAVEVVRGVHNAGGTACDNDQLAAQLNLEAKGGGFRLRISGAKSFGLLTYERGGRVTLTQLGRQIIDGRSERSARMDAFLHVELYQKVFDQFKGGPLPPQAGLERALVSLGVGAGVSGRARQVMLRAAKQAGFFEHATDRLVKPAIRQEDRAVGEQTRSDGSVVGEQGGRGGNEGKGDGGGAQHQLVQGLLATLPESGDEWSAQDRVNWLTLAASIFKMIYTEQSPTTITIKADGGSTSAA